MEKFAWEGASVRPTISIDGPTSGVEIATRGCVYFMASPNQTENRFPVKIGHTTDKKTRLMALQTGNPEKLEILGVIETSVHSKLEKGLHTLFWQFRRENTEWFNLRREYVDTALATWDSLMEIDGESDLQRCTRFLFLLRHNLLDGL